AARWQGAAPLQAHRIPPPPAYQAPAHHPGVTGRAPHLEPRDGEDAPGNLVFELPLPKEDHPLYHELDQKAEAGEVNSARKAFDGLFARAGLAGRGLHRVVWNTLIKAHANAGDAAGARAVFEEMSMLAVQPNRQTFGKLMESCAKAGQ
ncbi:unnamed protein product, partial [Polarella glacialis]